eukprot:Skav233124  [mRNA]  locus=scaffold792:23382:34891:+ [translate_table: standard]
MGNTLTVKRLAVRTWSRGRSTTRPCSSQEVAFPMSDADFITASWPGARAPISLLRPVPKAPRVRPIQADCMASPLLLPASLDLEHFDRCDSDPLLEAKRPTSPSLLSTGLEDSEGEDREEMLPLWTCLPWSRGAPHSDDPFEGRLVIMAEVDGEHAEARAALVRDIFFGEGGLNPQQWGIVYSHLYSYVANGSQQLLLADVLCGNAPCYDSVAGGPHTPLQRGAGTNQSRLHVVYRANQAYPRFLVTLGAMTLGPKAPSAALLTVRVPCRKRTNPRTPGTTPRTPVQRFCPSDVKVSHHEQILAVAWVDDSLCTDERAAAHKERVCSLKFHPELGHIVASGAINGKIRIVNTMSGSAECIAHVEEVATSATWNRTGDALAVGCDGGTLRVFYFQPKTDRFQGLSEKSKEAVENTRGFA